MNLSITNQNSWQLILNPHAGGGRGARDREKIVKMIHRSGLKAELSVSEYPGHAIVLARELAEKGASNFIVAGGDGTLNEVVNGIFSCCNDYRSNVTIGMVPVGTGNDWIKTFGIPEDYQSAIDLIVRGQTVFQDIGEISYRGHGQMHRRYFANIAGFGFDAVVARKANLLKAKGQRGIMVYLKSVAGSFLKYRSVATRFTIEGKPLQAWLFSCSVGIGKFNGGGMMQVPEANPLNGKLHVTIIRKIGIMGILANFRGLYSGKFIHDRRVSTHTCSEIALEADRMLPGEADGETLGNAAFTIKVLPGSLRVIYGSDNYLR